MQATERYSPNLIDILNEIMQKYGITDQMYSTTAKMLSDFELLNQVFSFLSFFNPLLETVFFLDFPSCESLFSYIGLDADAEIKQKKK